MPTYLRAPALCFALRHGIERIPIRALVNQRPKQAVLLLQQRFRSVELDEPTRIEDELQDA